MDPWQTRALVWLLAALLLCVGLGLLLWRVRRVRIRRQRGMAAALSEAEFVFFQQLQRILPAHMLHIQGKRFIWGHRLDQPYVVFIFRLEQPRGRDLRWEGRVPVLIYKDCGHATEIQEDLQQMGMWPPAASADAPPDATR